MTNLKISNKFYNVKYLKSIEIIGILSYNTTNIEHYNLSILPYTTVEWKASGKVT